MEIRRVHRTTISDQICEQMKQMILDRTWKPGQKVPSEGELAEQFGVSRASIREALLKLNAVGLLESRFSGGHYVREAGADICMNAILPIVYVSNNSVMEVLEFRQVVEARIAGLAARRAGTEDVKRLNEIIREMEAAAMSDNLEKFSQADLRFHLELATITKNTLLAASMQLVREVLSNNMPILVSQRGYELGIRDHQKIVDAIRMNDDKRAIMLMEEHVEDICRTFSEVTAQNAEEGIPAMRSDASA